MISQIKEVNVLYNQIFAKTILDDNYFGYLHIITNYYYIYIIIN